MRGILHIKKIGHTGTLDPSAEGVLPICFGKATKVCDFLSDRTKTYRAKMILGITTDTDDMDGTILKECPVNITSAELFDIMERFHGALLQIPPMYSAKKINGKKLYQYAREGETVERKPSEIFIHEIRIESVELPEAVFTVTCSKGTYIRALIRDIGQAAGCGAAMSSLLRTRVGSFEVQSALKLSEVETLAAQDALDDFIYPVDSAFSDCPSFVLSKEESFHAKNGCPVALSGEALKIPEDSRFVRVYLPDHTFLGIYDPPGDDGLLHVRKMFYEPASSKA